MRLPILYVRTRDQSVARCIFSFWLIIKEIPVGAKFSVPVQPGPGVHLASYTMGTGSFQGVKSGWGVTLTSYPLLEPWS